ncbi:MAG: alpha/beta hydrolase [Asgard group archaeon]|nr:alpha/beta hydrolase [Asgard group archaeon]
MISIDFLAKLLSLPYVVIKAVLQYFTVGTIYSRTNIEFRNSLWKNVLLSVEYHMSGNYKKQNVKAVVYEPVEKVFKQVAKNPMVKSLNGFGEKFDARSYWIHKSDNPSGKVLVYLHGGGYLLNLFKSQLVSIAALHYALDARVADELSILVVDYLLTLFDHVFPAQLVESLESYTNLIKAGFKDIHLIGDSAGGHLAVNMQMAIANPKETKEMFADFGYDSGALDGKLVAPKSLSLLSPWVQPTVAPIVSPGVNTWGDLGALDTTLGELFVEGIPKDQLARYNRYINLCNVPPLPETLVIVGEREVLKNGIDMFVADAQGPIEYHEEPGGIHAAMVYVEGLDYSGNKGAKRAIAGDFTNKFAYNLVAEFLSRNV